MANKKQFHASLIIAGHLSSTLKSAFGSTQRNVQRIGAAVTTLRGSNVCSGKAFKPLGAWVVILTGCAPDMTH